jgi:ABC-type uncharacterized transport system auxiliary subunit
MSAIIIAGCGPKSYEKQQYILDTQRASSVVASDNQNIIEVRRFTINPAFSTKSLTYRTGEFEYESDFYNEFLVSPGAMVTEKVRNWLSASGLSRRVLDPGSYVDPTHVIEGNVIALYGDFRDKSSPAAVMEIRIFLLEMKTGNEPVIVFGKTYKSSVALESKSPGDLVSALDRCLVKTLNNLEKDLAERLL